VLGGTSSIAKPIIETAIFKGYKVDATFRSLDKTWQTEGLSWHFLDIARVESIRDLKELIEYDSFERILYLIGSLSHIEISESDFEELSEYISTHLTNPIYLLNQILDKISENSRLLIMSSRAAKQSHDIPYAVIKCGLETFVRSARSRTKTPNISYIRSGLILDSKMASVMTQSDMNRHLELSEGNLLNVESAASRIWSLFSESWQGHASFSLGQDY
jgi:NAD(P)-dependent dehydrogenase (short-subunit alcohol dehydrogenase family)